MKTSLLILLILTSSLSMASNYYKNGKLLIVTHYSPPWSYKNCTGAEIDIIKAAFKVSNIEIECLTTSYARLVNTFLSKRVLFASPVAKFESQKVGAYYSDRFVDYTDVAVSFKDKDVTLKEMIPSRIVGYQKASHYLGEEFTALTKKAKFYREIPGRDNQIEMLKKNRVDYVVGEKNILMNISKKLYPNQKMFINNVIKKWDLRAASHDKDIMDKFNKGLKVIRDKGLIKSIFKKYNIQH